VILPAVAGKKFMKRFPNLLAPRHIQILAIWILPQFLEKLPNLGCIRFSLRTA